MRSVVLIPSRLASTRLAGKALLQIGGIPMIARVMIQAKKCPDIQDVFVCTDSLEIAEVVKKYGGQCIMTSETHQNGTTRIAEAKKLLPDYDLYIDVQGDEPFINPEHISAVIECHKQYQPDIVLPILPFHDSKPSHVKVVTDVNGRVMYLSRADIPYHFSNKCPYNKHLSIVGFSPTALDRFASLPMSPLESVEGVELLRAVENGMYIQTIALNGDSFSIDTIQDYEKALRRVADGLDII
jgi:3-deoxy-manno-octulosonate cytidylyltransferase (CMP-KDO synthetase)